MTDFANVTPKQAAAIAAMLAGHTQRAAADIAGVNESTLTRWKRQPEFQRALTEATDEAVSAAVRRMAGGADKAVEVLLSIVENPDVKASSRVNSARILLGELRSLRDSHDINLRLTALEMQLEANAETDSD